MKISKRDLLHCPLYHRPLCLLLYVLLRQARHLEMMRRTHPKSSPQRTFFGTRTSWMALIFPVVTPWACRSLAIAPLSFPNLLRSSTFSHTHSLWNLAISHCNPLRNSTTQASIAVSLRAASLG